MIMSETEKDEKKAHISIPPTLQRVLPRTITGAVSLQNKDTVDWGWQGFIAFGVQATVVIIDPVTLQCAQTLSKHQAHVCQVKWKKTSHYHQLSSSEALVLASADIGGTIYVWNVAQGEVLATLQDGNKPILEIEWLENIDGSEYLLAALHPPYSIVLWDTRHSSKIWKKSYTESLLSFQFDPFHLNKMAFLCQGCILLVDDFNISKYPSSNGNRFFISAPSQSPARTSTSSQDDREKSSSLTLRKKMMELVAGEVKTKSDDSTNISECQEIFYHRTIHDQLLILYLREILIFDLIINQTVGVIGIDRSMSNIFQVILCWQRDVIYCLHESGSVACYLRKGMRDGAIDSGTGNIRDCEMNGTFMDFAYERKCHSEALRLSRSNRPIGMTVDPISERRLCLVLGDGRVVFKELITSSYSILNGPPQKLDSFAEYKVNIRDDHFSPEPNFTPAIKMPILSLSQLINAAYETKEFVKDFVEKKSGNIRLMMTGLMPSLASPPLVIRMCPPLTTRNIQVYVPLMAVGMQPGSVQVINLATGVIEREFWLHTYPVKGIEWTTLTSFLSFANQALTSSQGKVRNELIHTDSRTGYSITLRANKTEETPIEMIKVSYLKQYFIVVLKDDPFELWDCQTLTPLRTMPRRFPKISALEWSPTTHLKNRKESVSLDGRVLDSDLRSSSSKDDISSLASSFSYGDAVGKSIIKENLVFTDTQGQLYRFSVEGNVIKDGSRNPPDPHMNVITCIARKSNDIILGDSDGSLAILDLKSRTSKHINTHRGWVRKLRFAPGKDNMKLLVLYGDGVDIWDIKEAILVAQLKSPKSTAKILDIDWGASDRPVLASLDGCLKIMDIHLKTFASPITHYFTKDLVTSPYLMKRETALNLKTMMSHQPWRDEYSLSFLAEDGFENSQLDDVITWLSRIPPEVTAYLKSCKSVSHRALLVAYLFGDQGELTFWTVVTYYLSRLVNGNSLRRESRPKHSPSDGETGSSSSFVAVKTTKPEGCEDPPLLEVPHLDTSFYHMCDNAVFKKHELERLFIHESKDINGSLRENLGRCFGIIGEKDRVVRLLLDADSSDPQFYPDCLRACLLSATHHSNQAQSTIKLVATNLIAAGKIWEGIELLCIIGKAADACRYLQSYGYWNDSIWLAKCVLSPAEASDVTKRWALHLISNHQKDTGVCALLSIGAVGSALEQLVQHQYYQRASLLLESAIELNILKKSGDGFSFECDPSISPKTSLLSNISENIYKKYVLFLFGIGNRKAVRYFSETLGDVGKELLQELEVL